MEKHTPLYDEHLKAGGKMVAFAGYELPVQYPTGVIKEHMAVRSGVGIFDVSHMGEITVRGCDALASLNHILTNDYTSLKPGKCRYSPMCSEAGGTLDDLIVCMKAENDYLVVVNAAGRERDYEWIRTHLVGDAVCEDISDSVAQIAVQGPKAVQIVSRLADRIPEKYYTVIFDAKVGDIPCIIARTGYTGEDGFELYCQAQRAAELWNLLLENGKEYDLIPCGLGARDTLRLEASMPLYGHEMSDDITPVEAGLGAFVKMGKAEFIGRDALAQKTPARRMRVGLAVTGRGIIREEQSVRKDGKEVGHTT